MSAESAMHRVRVDGESCVTTGFCVAAAPTMFEIDHTAGHARVLIERVRGGEPLALAEDAASMCPVGAVTVEPERAADA